MAIAVTPGLERKNRDLIQRHIQTIKADQQRRQAEGDQDLQEACKEAGGWVWHRGRGRKFIFT